MNKVFGLTAILILIAAVYCTFSNTWPVLQVNQWQAKVMDDNRYFPVLTIFLMALPPLLILLLIKLVVLRLSKKQQ